jgi:hypothetical protein
MSSWIRCLSVAALAGAAAEGACAAPPAGAGGAARPTIKAIAQDPAAWLDKEAALTGTLENQGANYFTDLRVVLRDDEGNAVAVKPWLPVSVPPGPKTGPRPKTLSSYLGKKVDLQCTVRRGELRGAGTTYYLEVKQARTLDSSARPPD